MCFQEDSSRGPGVPEHSYGDTSFRDVPSPHRSEDSAQRRLDSIGDPQGSFHGSSCARGAVHQGLSCTGDLCQYESHSAGTVDSVMEQCYTVDSTEVTLLDSLYNQRHIVGALG